MFASQTSRFSLKRAMFVSVALHAFAAAFILAGPMEAGRRAGSSAGASEAVHVSTITLAAQHVAAANAIVHPRPPMQQPVASPRPLPPSGATTRIARVRSAVSAPPGVHNTRAPVSRTVEKPVAIAAPVASARDAVTTPVLPSPAASPAAAPPQALAVAQRAAVDTSNGGWGQSANPLVDDDDRLAYIRAQARAAGTVSIEVDEKGNATRVTLPASLDASLKAALEKEFLSMHYLPAECNGLKCVGTLQLAL